MITLKHAKQLVVLVVGGSIVLLGLVLLVTPGPAFIVIPCGLAVLATEFVWARRLLKRIKRDAQSLANSTWRAVSGEKAQDSP